MYTLIQDKYMILCCCTSKTNLFCTFATEKTNWLWYRLQRCHITQISLQQCSSSAVLITIKKGNALFLFVQFAFNTTYKTFFCLLTTLAVLVSLLSVQNMFTFFVNLCEIWPDIPFKENWCPLS